MTDVEIALKEVKEELYSSSVIQEYLSLKKQIENNPELLSLEKEVREHQKKMCENIQNDEVYIKEKELYELKQNKLKAHPLYQNFESSKEEVVALLKQIKEALQ